MTSPKEYGRALLLLADEEGCADLVREDILAVKAVICESPSYTRLIDTPALPKEERLGLIDEAFGGLNRYLLNLIKILAEGHAASCLPSVIEAYLEEYDLARGIERVEAISAVPMTEAQLSALSSRLEKQTGKKIIIRNTTDPAILGGVKLRYAGRQLDGSVRTRLDSLEKNLKEILI